MPKTLEIDLNNIFSLATDAQFNHFALNVFRFQAENNMVYKSYLAGLKINSLKIDCVEKIPFLPIEFFKSHDIITRTEISKTNSSKKKHKQETFTSSGTSTTIQSKHFVADVSLYQKSYRAAFKQFYGEINEYCILALLPSYLERDGSSLIYMVNDLIKLSNHSKSNFYLNNQNELIETLAELSKKKQKIILLGVTYALLDLAEKISDSKIDKSIFNNVIVMETGGMKGKRKEMIKEEIHFQLKNSFGVNLIHSEYGMTELLSQAYSKGDGLFYTPPWMKILIRDINDPFTLLPEKKSGGINIIDLANVYSCSFIASQDLGKTHSDNSFEVLGRFDVSDIRGCNFLVQ